LEKFNARYKAAADKRREDLRRRHGDGILEKKRIHAALYNKLKPKKYGLF